MPEVGSGGEIEAVHVAALMNLGRELVEPFVGGGREPVKAIDKRELIVDIIKSQWRQAFENFLVTLDRFLIQMVPKVEPFVDDDFIQKYVAALHLVILPELELVAFPVGSITCHRPKVY